MKRLLALFPILACAGAVRLSLKAVAGLHGFAKLAQRAARSLDDWAGR